MHVKTLSAFAAGLLALASSAEAASASSLLQFSAAKYGAVESSTNSSIVLVRSGNLSGAVTVDLAVGTNSSAVEGIDFSSGLTQQVAFATGQRAARIFLPLLNDTVVDGPKTIQLTLANPSNGALLGTRSNSVVTVVDDEKMGTIAFKPATYRVSEQGTNVTLQVVRIGGTGTAMTVDYFTTNGTAKAGLDFTATGGTLTFNAGETTHSITVPILEDAMGELAETFMVKLVFPSSGADIRGGTAVVKILDNDSSVQFDRAVVSSFDTAKSIKINLKRIGATNAPGSVTFSTSNGTALEGEDYVGTNVVVDFAARDLVKTVTLTLLRDTNNVGSETVNLQLSNPTGDLTLGENSSAVLNLLHKRVGLYNDRAVVGTTFRDAGIDYILNPVVTNTIAAGSYNSADQTLTVSAVFLGREIRRFQLQVPNVTGIGTYSITNLESLAFLSITKVLPPSTTRYELLPSTGHGAVRVTVFDPTNNIIKGNFNFTLTRVQGSANPVNKVIVGNFYINTVSSPVQ